MEAFVPAAAPPEAMTLDGSWYTSDAVFAREQERIFASSWICVGRAEHVAATGQFFVVELAGESVILTRDESGAIRAYYNVCRHRGTRLCLSERGTFKGSIQCPYHAWTYGLDGELRVARNMEALPWFDASRWALHQVPVETFEGFLFINLDRDPQSFEAYVAPLTGRFAAWNLAGLASARRVTYDLACNWKLVFLNYSECYHCPIIHPQLEKLSSSDSGRNDLCSGPFLGGYSTLKDPQASLNTNGRRARAPVGTVSGENLARVYYYTVFPSMLLSLHPDYAMVHYVEPLCATRTRVVCEWLFEPAQMADPHFDASDAVDFWDLTNRQDWKVNELTQLGVASRAYAPGPYSQQEGLLHAFDSHYLSIMNA